MLTDQHYGDISSQNPVQLKAFVQALITEVDFYKKSQLVLQSEIDKLLVDNKDLSQRLELCLKDKYCESVENYNVINKDLRLQITQITNEKESFIELWKTSQKTIENLETELQTYQSKYSQDVEEMKGISHYNIIEELKIKLRDALKYQNAVESKFRETKTENVNYSKKLAENTDIIVGLEKKLKEYFSKIEELKLEVNLLKGKTQHLLSETKNSISEQCCVRETEAKKKVEEALIILEAAISERDSALNKAEHAEGQSALMKAQIDVLLKQVTDKARIELEEVRKSCDEKITDMLTHVQMLDHQGTEKALALAKTTRECKILRAENGRYAKVQSESQCGVRQELLLMEQRLEQLHKKLITSERKNLRLTSDKQCLNVELHQLRLAHQREIKKKNFEEKILVNEVDELRKKCDCLQNSLDDCHVRVQALQCELSTKAELNEKLIIQKEDAVSELNKHIEQQINLNKQWKTCYSSVTLKLESSLLQLQEENAHLRMSLKIYKPDISEDS